MFYHYIKHSAVKTKARGCFSPPAPGGSRVAIGCLFVSESPLHSLFLSFLQKEIDPGDFSPCIKQETIINV